MERTTNFVNVWFWARNDPAVPDVLKTPTSTGQINTAHLGTPYANFVNANCDIASKFGPNNIIINLTFCKFISVSVVVSKKKPLIDVCMGMVTFSPLGGGWAGSPSAYPATCPQTCKSE